MLWVYGHYKYFPSYSAGIDFSRQNLTSTDVRSDVYRRQILTTKVGSGAVRVNASAVCQTLNPLGAERVFTAV